MTGLLLLAAIIFVLMAIYWVAKTIGNTAGNPTVRTGLKVGIFLTLLSLPFVDEVIGKHQFEALCNANGIESADVSRARGRSVKVTYLRAKAIEDSIVPIEETSIQLVDSTTEEVLAQYKVYLARGGWLMRYTWLSMGGERPMLFPAGCNNLAVRDRVFAANNINKVN